MNFSTVAKTFSAIESETKRLVITRFLHELFKQTDGVQARYLSYLSLGELQPPYRRLQFSIADKMAIRAVAQALDQDEQSIASAAKRVGDLGAVVAEFEWQVSVDLSLDAVYEQLADLARLSGSGSQDEKINALADVLRSLDPLSAKYVVRIVLGKLRLGFSDMTIIDALSWCLVGDKSLRGRIEHAYNVCADIGLIAQAVVDTGIDGVDNIHVTVGIPIRPAAAERASTAQAIIDKIGPCVAQPKIDGFRIQVHVDKSSKEPLIRFFSRNLTDMSHMFPDVVKACKGIPVHNCIAEGEAIVVDPNTGQFLPFQETIKRKRKHGIASAAQECPLHVYFFDVLFLDDKPLLSHSHEERRALLVSMLDQSYSHGLFPADEVATQTAPELNQYFHQCVSDGLEGIVSKRPDAHYQPGKRNFNWIKLKRHDSGVLDDTVDGVVLGYYLGKGKRTQFGIGAFLVGVYDRITDQFETIAKVGTGLSDQDWKAFKQTCDEHVADRKPNNVVCAPELAPDVWLYPEIVCCIKAEEITKSPLHTAGKGTNRVGYALRFPRFVGYRPDKDPFQVTRVDEIHALFKQQCGRN